MSESTPLSPPPPWLAHYGPGVPAVVEHAPRCLHELLDDVVRRHPEREALVFAVPAVGRLFTSSITFRRLGLLVERFAASLQRLGVREGDRVAISLPNCPQFVIALLGAARAGAIAVPFNPLYSAREVGHQLQDSGATTMVVLDRFLPLVRTVRHGHAARARHRHEHQGALPAPAAAVLHPDPRDQGAAGARGGRRAAIPRPARPRRPAGAGRDHGGSTPPCCCTPGGRPASPRAWS